MAMYEWKSFSASKDKAKAKGNDNIFRVHHLTKKNLVYKPSREDPISVADSINHLDHYENSSR